MFVIKVLWLASNPELSGTGFKVNVPMSCVFAFMLKFVATNEFPPTWISIVAGIVVTIFSNFKSNSCSLSELNDSPNHTRPNRPMLFKSFSWNFSSSNVFMVTDALPEGCGKSRILLPSSPSTFI